MHAFYALVIAGAAFWAVPRNAYAQLYVTNMLHGAAVVSEYNAETGEVISA